MFRSGLGSLDSGGYLHGGGSLLLDNNTFLTKYI